MSSSSSDKTSPQFSANKSRSELFDLSIVMMDNDDSSIIGNSSVDSIQDTTFNTTMSESDINAIQSEKIQVPHTPLPIRKLSIKEEKPAGQRSPSIQSSKMPPPPPPSRPQSQTTSASNLVPGIGLLRRHVPGAEEMMKQVNHGFSFARPSTSTGNAVTRTVVAPPMPSTRPMSNLENQSEVLQARDLQKNVTEPQCSTMEPPVLIKTEDCEDVIIVNPNEFMDLTGTEESPRHSNEKCLPHANEDGNGIDRPNTSGKINEPTSADETTVRRSYRERSPSSQIQGFESEVEDAPPSRRDLVPTRSNSFGQVPQDRRPKSRANSMRLPTGSRTPLSRRGSRNDQDEINVVHSILDKRFREANALQSQLAELQDVIYEIDERLELICDKDQEMKTLQGRCGRLLESIDQQRQARTLLTDEIGKLQFQVHSIRDELERKKIDAENQSARARDKQEQSLKVITRLQQLVDSSTRQQVDLKEDYTQVKGELSMVLKEREMLIKQIGKSNGDIEKLRGVIRACEEKLKEQRASYGEIHQRCLMADEVFIEDKMLKLSLKETKEELCRERETVGSLRDTLKSMTFGIGDLRASMDRHCGDITTQITESMESLNGLLAIQEEELKGFRNSLARVVKNSETPDPEILGSLSTIIQGSETKWTETIKTLSALQKDQKEVSQRYLEKVEKWKAIKETMAKQISKQAGELVEYQNTINILEQDKERLNEEVKKSKDLNRSLVEAHQKEKTLIQSKLLDTSHNLELSEAKNKEYELRNAVAESSKNSLEMELRNKETKIADLERQLDGEKRGLELARSEQQSLIDNLRRERENATKESGDAQELQKSLNEARKLNGELKDSLSEQTKKAEAAVKDVEVFKIQLKTKDEQLSIAATHLEEVSLKLKRAENDLRAAKVDAQLYVEQGHNQKLELDGQAKRASALEVELTGKTKQVNELGIALEAARAEQKLSLEAQKVMSDALKKRVEETDQERKALNKNLEDATKTIYELENDIKNEKDAEISRLKAELDLAKTDISRMEAKLVPQTPNVENSQEEKENETSQNNPTETPEKSQPERRRSTRNKSAASSSKRPTRERVKRTGGRKPTGKPSHKSRSRRDVEESPPQKEPSTDELGSVVGTLASGDKLDDNSVVSQLPASQPSNELTISPHQIQQDAYDLTTFFAVSKNASALQQPQVFSKAVSVDTQAHSLDDSQQSASAIVVYGTPDMANQNNSIANNDTHQSFVNWQHNSSDEVAFIPATQFSTQVSAGSNSTQNVPQTPPDDDTPMPDVEPRGKKRAKSVHFASQTQIQNLSNTSSSPQMLYNHAKNIKPGTLGSQQSQSAADIFDEDSFEILAELASNKRARTIPDIIRPNEVPRVHQKIVTKSGKKIYRRIQPQK